MEVCSKCKKNPRADADSTNPWCNPCKTEYAKEYQAIKKEMMKQRGFHEGVREMRTLLAGEFGKLGGGSFSGYEIRELIMQAPGPTLD